MSNTRRRFLADVGRGMLVASVGPALATDLGFSQAWGDDSAPRLKFGKLEPLVTLMQESTAEQMLPRIVNMLKTGVDLKEVVSAAALANVRTFGGEDYVGFHTMMALYPAYQMARELPTERQALPVLKVLYRNCQRMQERGVNPEVLHEVPATTGTSTSQALRDACHKKDVKQAEIIFKQLATSPEDALNSLLPEVHESTEVHRIVMVSRSWDMLELVGREHAHTLLRQSVHYCIKSENDNQKSYFAEVRGLLPKLMEKYQFDHKSLGKKPADDAWVDHLAKTIFSANAAQAAEAAAMALSEGYLPDAVGEAITLAANQLVLRDKGRYGGMVQPNKLQGSVHGDSIGVHASDSANAWRNLARHSKHTAACLILGAYQVALDRTNRGGDFLKWEPYPHSEHSNSISKVTPENLNKELEDAIRAKEQARACALVNRIHELKQDASPVFATLLKFAISEDGALHAEKYYRTVVEEFNSTREAFRWRQLLALARVTASECGHPAPGYDQACKLLKV